MHHSFHTMFHSVLSHNNNNGRSCKNTQNAPKLHIAYTKPDDPKNNIFSYFHTNTNTHNNINPFPHINKVERICLLQTLFFNFVTIGNRYSITWPFRQSFKHLKKHERVKKVAQLTVIKPIHFCQIVGNKAKVRISKRVFQEKKARQMFLFWKIWRAFFSWNTRFVIRPFALLTTWCYFDDLGKMFQIAVCL